MQRYITGQEPRISDNRVPGPRQDIHVTPEGHMTMEEEDVVVTSCCLNMTWLLQS